MTATGEKYTRAPVKQISNSVGEKKGSSSSNNANILCIKLGFSFHAMKRMGGNQMLEYLWAGKRTHNMTGQRCC